MTRRLAPAVCAMAAALLGAGTAAAETIRADSKVTSVTVFPDRANVTRQAAIDLPKGQHAIEIAPLPSGVEPASLSAKGAGEADVTLYGVRLAARQRETAQDPRVEELEKKIREANQRRQELGNLKHVLKEEREYLASIQAASSQQIGKDLITKSPDASDAAALLEFIDSGLLRTFKREQEADVELEALAREIDKLERELNQLVEGRRREDTVLLVDLEAHKGGSFRLEISYRVPGATWQPAYEARASTEADDDVELATSALVRQQTGEDWTDVALTVSTARPALAGSMPELEPWFLRPWEAVPMAKMEARRALAGMAADSMQLANAPAAPEEQESRIAYAAVETAGHAVTFRLPKPATIPADWQPHKVPIASNRLRAALAYEATPRLLPHAFLRAKVTNTTEALYVPGPVSVFLDGTFVATSQLEQVAPGEEFELYLGVDERVPVERKTLKDRVEVSLLPGLRGKTKSTDYEFLTLIENFTGRNIAVTVFDQIPVSDREEIVVESVKYDPPTVKKDEEKPGVFTWTAELVPNQKQELRLSYRVRHPVDMRVQ